MSERSPSSGASSGGSSGASSGASSGSRHGADGAVRASGDEAETEGAGPAKKKAKVKGMFGWLMQCGSPETQKKAKRQMLEGEGKQAKKKACQALVSSTRAEEQVDQEQVEANLDQALEALQAGDVEGATALVEKARLKKVAEPVLEEPQHVDEEPQHVDETSPAAEFFAIQTTSAAAGT
jgi:hypothetical protein